MSDDGLSISQLAARTDVNPGTLRMWERRHGFPRPSRTPGRERRYTETDVDRVERIVSDRNAGMSLTLAIRRAVEQFEFGDVTLFAELRGRCPDLDVHVLSKRALIALSRAIEDECCAQARRPLLYGAFQRERFYRASQRRWLELSATAEVAVVFADFAAVAQPANAPCEVPLAAADPMLREWVVVCDAPGYAACLIGWERPCAQLAPDLDRSFEAVWSVDPDVVQCAARICNARLERVLPELASSAEASLSQPPSSIGSQQMRVAAGLTSRMAAYLDA